MENRFKQQISKLLHSTFTTCCHKTTADVSDRRFFFPENPRHRRLIDLFSPKPPPTLNPHPHLLLPPTTTDRTPQPLSPTTSKRGRKKKPHHRKRRNSASFSSITDNYYYNWWSSDEDDMFSRRSLSSDSLESLRKNRRNRDGGGGGGSTTVAGVAAVAKESSDPHEDFRRSMVDMIVEKGIFGVEELENLVECFVSINSEEHHKVIFEVFAEIWETLISDLYKKD